MNPIESHLFTVEEAFIRLGQSRLKGCLVVFNPRESVHLFVENGIVTCAIAGVKHGLKALEQALHLGDATYVWMPGADPVLTNMRENIPEYVLRHSMARDVRIGKVEQQKQKQKTEHFPSEAVVRKADKKDTREYHYFFTREDAPKEKIELSKTINLLGRDEYCDVIIVGPEISRKHCLVQVTERGLFVKDLDSANGTYVNGIALTDGYINQGDCLSLGPYELTLHKSKKQTAQLSGSRKLASQAMGPAGG